LSSQLNKIWLAPVCLIISLACAYAFGGGSGISNPSAGSIGDYQGIAGGGVAAAAPVTGSALLVDNTNPALLVDNTNPACLVGGC
jgi:hypothetical protein